MRRIEQIQKLARECIHFKGDRPCMPQAKTGVSCRCDAYCPRGEKILIVELTSPARVIQSSALVSRLKADNLDCHITYLTTFHQLLNADVDVTLPLDAASVAFVQMDQYDRLYNLDMDRRACAIANLIHTDYQKGFYLRQGNAMPVDEDSQLSYLRCVLPGEMQQGYSCPMRELFQNCGLEYHLEMPRLTASQAGKQLTQDETIIALWGQPYEKHERTWPEAHWIYLIETLQRHSAKVLLVGDAAWHGINSRIAQQSEAQYLGAMSWHELLLAINNSSAVVGVSDVAASMAVALGKTALKLEHDIESEAVRDRFRGRAVGIGPVESDGRQAGLADVLPDQVFDELMEKMALPKSRQEASAKRKPLNVADWLDVELARAATAQQRHRP